MTEHNESKAWLHGDLQGEVLGKHYVLEAKLGQGGMAWVYRAKHRLLGGNVAVKILFPQFAENENIRTRFLREAQIQYQLEHPHIVRVLDFIDERGLVGFVSEWCNGGDLVHWHQAQGFRSLASGEIRSLFLPLLDAIHLAHEHNVIHRDLKPHNIMLHQRGELLIPKLTDFGIAKQTEDQGLTSTGTVVGTVHYMSPEQLYESKSVDRRTDIYSLGVLLYQMTSGRLPFLGEAPSLFMKILEEKPPAIENIPSTYQAVLEKCLAKKPAERFANCMELRAILDQCLDPPLPILPLGQPLTDSALQQALIGFNSAASSSPGFSSGISSWNPQAVVVNTEQAVPKRIPSGVDVNANAHAETVLGKYQPKSGNSSIWRNLFLLLLCVVLLGTGWWIWEEYIHHPGPDAGIPIRTGILQPNPERGEKSGLSEEKGMGRMSPSQSVDAGEVADSKPHGPDAETKQHLPESDRVVESAEQKSGAESDPQPTEGEDIQNNTNAPKPPNPVRRREPPKVVKTRPKPLGLSALCSRGQASACYKLGQREEKKPHRSIRYHKVSAWYKKACERKLGKACGAMARLLYEGKTGTSNLSLARYYYSLGCAQKDALSCRRAGWLYQKGHGGFQSYSHARGYYTLACNMNEAMACNLLGISHSRGWGGLPNHSHALAFYHKSCQLKHEIGCYNVGMMYRNALGVARNHTVALQYFRRSCRMNSGLACAMAAQMFWSVSGQQACSSINSYLRLACRFGYKPACRMSCSSYNRIHRPKTWLDDSP